MPSMGSIRLEACLGPLALVASASLAWAYFPARHSITHRTTKVSSFVWHVDQVDPRFHVSREEVKREAERSVRLWEGAAGKHIFQNREGEGIAVRLVYDERQQSRIARQLAEKQLKAVEAELAKLKKQQGQTDANYRAAEADFRRAQETLNAETRAYNDRVNDINARGGASPDEASDLRAERDRLASAREEVQALADRANTIQESLNASVDQYNQLVVSFNQQVGDFNRRFSTPQPIVVGEYSYRDGDQSIDIYAFDDKQDLARVLAHEFGHALRVPHVRGDGSIMSAVENGSHGAKALKLSARDLAAFRSTLAKG